MKRNAKYFQASIVLIGMCTFAFLLWEPHIEGRNAHSTLFEIYFNDPFLAYAYIASIPFFIVLYKVIKVLGYYRQNKEYSRAAIKALRTIKYCAVSIIGFVAVGEIFIMLDTSDDRVGGVLMGIIITFYSVAIAAVAVKFERILHKPADIKSKNNLTL